MSGHCRHCGHAAIDHDLDEKPSINMIKYISPGEGRCVALSPGGKARACPCEACASAKGGPRCGCLMFVPTRPAEVA